MNLFSSAHIEKKAGKREIRENRFFFVAGIYGLLILAPIYFMENKIGRETPPAITHPEYFYGFLGAGLAWQVLFLALSRDPVRYRAISRDFAR